MRLLIVIVNYRSADLAIDCLRALQPELTPEMGVVIADNASDDDSVERLRTAAPWASVLSLPRNGGFAFANNAAIQSQEKSDYILLLNPDAMVKPGAISTMLQFMDAHPRAGIAGSRLEDPDGTIQRSAFRFHSIGGEFERGIRIGLVSRLLAKKIIAPESPSIAAQCDWVAGASMMIRRQVFDQIGLMDDKYFMYFEEVDFCLRAHRGNWECWYLPQSRVTHLMGAVSQVSDNRRHRLRRPAYWFESRRRYFVKNHGRIYATLADTAFLIGCALWRLRRFVQRKEDSDPPRLLSDSIAHSVFFRGWAL